MMRNSVLLLADVGLPMIALTLPAMVVLLVPIVLLAAWLLRKWLSIARGAAIKSSFVANAASTIVAAPGAWAVMLIVEFLVAPAIGYTKETNSPVASVLAALRNAAWIGPTMDSYWMIPVAVLGLLIPTYFASVVIESLIVDHLLTTSETPRLLAATEEHSLNLTSGSIRRAVWKANLASYGFHARC
jgi:hypothetical protein